MQYLPLEPSATTALEFFSEPQVEPTCYGFDALNNWIQRYAWKLQHSGLQRGDRVGLYLSNSAELIVALFGNHLLGLITVPINSKTTDEEFRYVARRAELSALVSSADAPLPLKLAIRPEELRELPPAADEVPQNRDLDAPALLCFTSGTTARPKGVILTHANLRSNLRDLIQVWRWSKRDRLLLTLPLFHVHGLVLGLHGWALTGCSLILTRKFDPKQVLDLLAEGRCTLFMGVPTMYHRMLASPGCKPKDFSSLRLAISGSAPMSVELHERCQEVIGQPVLERYGLTETIMNTSNPFEKRKPGSVGLPLPSVNIRLLDEELAELNQPNQIGEVCVQGPNVFSGYWKDPEATRQAFCDGWFRTGDVGYRDEEGYYHLLGRLSLDMIKSGGYRIGAREIEEVLLRHPSVQEAAVVGLPDVDLGEKVVAFVVADEETSEAELQTYCEEFLASFKRPRAFSFLDSLPRNAMGKVTKSQLKQLAV